MTIVHMSEKGQLVVPKPARTKRGLGLGSPLEFIDGEGGDLIFRPVKTKPALDLVDHLKALRGTDIPSRKCHCPPRT